MPKIDCSVGLLRQFRYHHRLSLCRVEQFLLLWQGGAESRLMCPYMVIMNRGEQSASCNDKHASRQRDCLFSRHAGWGKVGGERQPRHRAAHPPLSWLLSREEPPSMPPLPRCRRPSPPQPGSVQHHHHRHHNSSLLRGSPWWRGWVAVVNEATLSLNLSLSLAPGLGGLLAVTAFLF